MRAAGVVLGTRPLVGDTMSSLVSGNITDEGGALSMLELAEGTIWGSRTVLKIANCVYLCSVQRSTVRQRRDSTVWNDAATDQPNWSKGLNQTAEQGLSQQNSRVVA